MNKKEFRESVFARLNRTELMNGGVNLVGSDFAAHAILVDALIDVLVAACPRLFELVPLAARSLLVMTIIRYTCESREVGFSQQPEYIILEFTREALAMEESLPRQNWLRSWYKRLRRVVRLP